MRFRALPTVLSQPEWAGRASSSHSSLGSSAAETSRQGAAAHIHTATKAAKAPSPKKSLRQTEQLLPAQRHLHQTSIVLSKPSLEAYHRLQALQVTLPDRDFGDASLDGGLDVAQILAEWRARRAQQWHVPSEKGKEPVRGGDNSLPLGILDDVEARTPKNLPDDFFSAGVLKSPSRQAIGKETPAVTVSPSSSTHHSDRQRALKRSWLSTIDQELRIKILSNAVADIIAGSCYLPSLAQSAVTSLKSEGVEIARDELDRRSHQLQLAILDFWISSAKTAIRQLTIQPRFAAYFTVITQELYASLYTGKVADLGTLSSSPLQRATLHRMFGIFFEIAHHPAVPSATQHSALAFCALLLRDPYLKPSQARLLLRKLLSRIHLLLRSSKGPTHLCRAHQQIWDELHTSIMYLWKSQVIVQRGIGNEDQDSGKAFAASSTFNHMEEYVRVASYALARNAAAPFSLDWTVAATLESSSQMPALDVEGPATSLSADTVGQPNFMGHERRLQQIVSNLTRAKAFETAYTLVFSVPASQRSLGVILPLIKHWSSTPLHPALDLPDDSAPVRTAPMVDGVKDTDTKSLRLLAEVKCKLDKSKSTFRTCLVQLCEARFEFHARRGCIRSVLADLHAARSVLLDMNECTQQTTLIEVLSQLSEEAQVNAIRAYVANGLWTKAISVAKKLLMTRSKLGQLPSHQSTRFLNALIAATDRGPLLERRQRLPSPKARMSRLLTFIERFCQETGAIPDRQTRQVLLHVFLRLVKNTQLSRSAFEGIACNVDWDWRRRGVAAVVRDIRVSINGGLRESSRIRTEGISTGSDVQSQSSSHMSATNAGASS